MTPVSTFTLDTAGASERWAPIPGWVGLYEASNMGRVRSLPRTVDGRPGTCRMIHGVVLAQKSLKDTAYRYVNLSRKGKQTGVGVHRLVAMAFLPNYDAKPEVNHFDNDPSNNRATNLRWATTLENAAHKCSQVRARGHLTAEDVHAIRAAWPTKPGPLAQRYGVTPSHIWRIGTGRAHRHLEVRQ